MVESENLNSDEKEETKELYTKMIQNHHDHFVALARAGRLTQSDSEDFNLAIVREQGGLVEPLPYGAEVEIILRLDALEDEWKEYVIS